ncbi:ROK family protein [Methyloversatilis sp.]|uniref:ROK family protein n=1 Tax=Methyloversatilis sp. TaxID=2569862 RepID=UPI0027347FB2|nr:ROK family protein [Methyloversatilis sp.]MDP2870437.1 ROK family protein [Methyloversatilis sp.]MDP3288067.1 ROK family protein [Methyloversatilis sp.]MDP3457244.1 ROK family protein [Methyloversatilis sp.]MDP3576636.1 ROK family protein [Methyloversatilis sp.]
MRIGIDLGGTKTELIALDGNGTECLRKRAPTPTGDYAATVALIARLVHDAEHLMGARATVGIGTPGSRSPLTGRMRNANSTCLNGQPLQQDVETALGREVRMANDANCFALSEAVDGAGRGAPVVFGVILGTGVGGGIVVDGRVLNGANGVAGEWGHNPMPSGPDTEGIAPPPCYCGRAGCIETWLSGPALAADHRRVNEEPLAPEAIVARAAAGDAAAAATLARYEIRLARALAAVINLLDPQVIVLGGGLSALPGLYERVPQHWSPHVFSDLITTRLCPPVHGDSSGVRGAAWLW